MKQFILFTILIFLLTGIYAQKTQTQTYQAENSGYFINPIKTPYGIVFTDNYASKVLLLNNGKIETLVESPGCGRYFSVSSDFSKIGYKKITKQGKQMPAFFDLKNKKNIELLTNPVNLCSQVSFSDDNNSFAFSINNEFCIKTGNAIAKYGTDSYSNLSAVSPDKKYAVYDVEQNYFKLLDLNSLKQIIIPNDNKGVIYPKWSPDSKKILFQNKNMELLVYELKTKKLYKLGKGGAGNWDAKSENIIFQKTDADATNFILKSSDIYIADYKGLNTRQITNTPDVYEMTPSFDLQNGILFQTYDKRQIIRAKLNISKSKIISTTVLLDNPQNLKPKFYDLGGLKSTKAITHLTKPVPYIHQKYDAPTGRNGGSACAPTTTNMALAYYNRLPKWPVAAESYPSVTGTPHYSDYSGYVLDRYKYNEFSFDAYSSSKNAYGGYAYMWVSPYTSPGGGDGMRNYQNLHNLVSGSYVWLGNATFAKTQAEIDAEYPHPICSWITASGHLTLVVGYVNGQHTLIFNDPWGDKNTPGYPSYDGVDAYYDWPGYNNGFQNLDADGSHGTVAWTLTARSSEQTYDNLTIQNTYYNHGFYINNSQNGATQRYYRHVKNAAGSNGHIWWTGGEGGASSDICWVSWTPDLPNSASYKVEVYIPATFTDSYSAAAVTSSAYYKIFYDGGNTSVTVNQLANQGAWVDIGTYQFSQGKNGYVRLGDAVAYADNGKKVLFDAVRFTQVAGSLELASTNITCTGASDGTATVTTTPGPPTHTYLWSPGGETTLSVSGLSAGTYTVTVTDGNSATYNASVIIKEASQLLAVTTTDTNPSSFGASDGQIVANVTGGIEPYTYVWTPNVSTTNIAQNLTAGIYTVEVTDAYGCVKQKTVTLTDPVCTSCCILLSEDFTGQVLPSGWTNTVHSGGFATYDWRFNDPGGRYGSGILTGADFDADFAIFDDDWYGDNTNKSDASLTTPAINCTGRDMVVLKFTHRFRSSANIADGKVQVSNDGSIWNDVVTYNTVTFGPEVIEFDISAYAANQATVYVRWRYTDNNNWSNYWAVDNIEIYAPPAGTKTISAVGGDYANFTEAINAINTCGIGTGGITFLVASDEIFNEDPPVITATGDATRPVIFQKYGNGANPVIKPTGTASFDDAAISLAGCDYFTFDGIDISIASGSAVEYGYYLYNTSATNGSQYNTVKNCSINLSNTNETSKGIFQNIKTGTINPTSAEGTNSFNVYDNVSIQNSYYGICLHGYDVAGQEPVYDDACIVQNVIIDNFGLAGASINRATGIQTWSQKNLSINNNTVKNGNSADRTLGIYCAGNNSGNIFSNTVFGLYGKGIQVVGIRQYNSSMNIYLNEVHNIEGIKMATGIEGYGGTSNVYNNFVYDIKAPSGNSTLNGYPSTRGISFRYTAGTQNIFYNSVYIAYNSTNAGNESTCLYLEGSSADFRNNVFENNTNATTGTRANVLYFKLSADLGNVSAGTNNNCYYNGIANSKYALAYDAGNIVDYLDLPAYRIPSPNDINSIEENPPFKSTILPYNLHIDVTQTSGISNGGTPITGYTSDFDGDTRHATTPDIGADEYNTGNPLCGTYTIDNTSATVGTNFNRFTDAINSLNDRGISCAVVFNVLSGQVFIEDVPSLEISGTATNTITFQKSGISANPVLKPTGTTADEDFGIHINGGDYYTFDGIDISIASGSDVEYGYYITTVSPTDGAQHNTIKNCTVTLNNNNINSVGIYQLVRTTITPTSISGTNSFNTYDNISVESSYNGFKVFGYDVTGQEPLYDDAVEIMNCTVNNFGISNGASRAVGILTWSQKNLAIHHNTITNGTTNHRTLGIYGAGNNQGNFYNNIVHGLYGTASQVVGLRAYESTINFYNNDVYDIEGVDMASGIEIYGGTADIYNNFVHDIRTPATDTYNYPTTRGISNRKGTANIYNNSILLNFVSTAETNESAGIFTEGFSYGSASSDVRNNIVVNKVDVTIGAIAATLYKSAEYSTISTNSDNNLYYAGTPSVKNLIYYDTNVSDQILASYKIRCVTYEQNTISEDAAFISSTDLHIQTSAITNIDGGGQVIAGITADFDGEIRDLTVPDIGADEYNCDFIVWRGTSNTDWADATNWQKQQVPTVLDNVVIPDVSLESNNFPIITSAGETNNLTIQSGANLQINPGFSLSVNGTMTNNAGNTGLVIKSDVTGTGSFINSTINVPATVERYLSGTQWHYLTPPVVNAPLTMFNTNNFYYYDETTSDSWSGGTITGTQGWISYAASNLTTMQGYAYYFTETTLNFSGNLHTGTYTSPLLSWTNTAMADQFEGWHLLGNPYTSVIDFSQANIDNSNIILTNLDQSVYFYDDVIHNYRGYNTISGAINGGTQYIPAMQGFFVHASVNNAQIQITNGARVHNTTNFYKETTGDLFITLQTSANGFFDETKIIENPNANFSFDGQYDLYKMYSLDENVPLIWTTNNNIEFALNAVPYFFDEQIIKLGFKGNNSDVYEISLSGTNLSADIFIVDKFAGTYQNLKETSVYTFTHSGGATFDRFELHFSQPTNIADISADNISIYPNPAKNFINIIVSNEFSAFDIEITDVLGKKVCEKPNIKNTFKQIDISGFKSGTYFIKVKTKNKYYTEKLIVK
ncbi:MAG: T9SS type A sorting domain-containing protein [Bacteroidales bacterium]|nr:T9SS type A sorting domain-containing protein [Bacteroidales bacterium]